MTRVCPEITGGGGRQTTVRPLLVMGRQSSQTHYQKPLFAQQAQAKRMNHVCHRRRARRETVRPQACPSHNTDHLQRRRQPRFQATTRQRGIESKRADRRGMRHVTHNRHTSLSEFLREQNEALFRIKTKRQHLGRGGCHAEYTCRSTRRHER